MVSISGCPVTCKLCVNLCASCKCVLLGFENKRIAVSEEYAADTIAVDGVSHGDLAHDFFIGKFFKLDAAVHVAVSAVVVRASTSHAEDEAFCFTRRTVNWGFVVVKK